MCVCVCVCVCGREGLGGESEAIHIVENEDECVDMCRACEPMPPVMFGMNGEVLANLHVCYLFANLINTVPECMKYCYLLCFIKSHFLGNLIGNKSIMLLTT